ncbi:MAG TPA: Rieske 2Fe-2S domain-containing protein [Acidimicrobiales bacterium]|nr:Rieske 2Fe-2S domain-containing protein [Acidimicrobiales bacterium]
MPVGWALLPLRAFLGITFCFAGLQKLANPNFFDPNSPSGIQAQLVAANRTSPLHPLLGHLLHLSTPIGVLIALSELAVGLGTVLGLWTRVAAAGGLLLSLTLFLTVSFHSSPYFTGADIVFVFAWTPLILAGAGGVLSLDAAIAARAARTAGDHLIGARAAGAHAAGADPADTGPSEADVHRRTVVLGAMATGATALAAVALAGLAAGLGRAVGGAKPPASDGTVTLSGGASASTSTTTTSTSTPAGGGSTTTTGATPKGTAIGQASDVPVGGSARFTDPASGDPGLLLQLTKGSYVAYDAVCPHAGCTVGYSPAAQLIVCPCHGSEFNPATGAVEVGPATRGLKTIKVAEGGDGQLYVDG